MGVGVCVCVRACVCSIGGDSCQYSAIPLATIFTLGGGAFRVVEACLNERSIRVERRVSTRGVFGWRGVSQREEYSGGEACLDEKSRAWWIGVSLDQACAQ